MSAAPDDPGPGLQVSLLTGFLGSGKTTLLNRLLAHPDMGETAVLVNEFGDVGIDHALVESVDAEMVQLATGCLCCTIQGDLARTLRAIFLKRVKGEVPAFRRVLIETTGLADPAPILHTLVSDPVIANRYFLDGVIATVDALFGAGQLSRHPESRKQAAVADRLVLTKCDLADDDAIARLEAALGALNPAAPVIRAAHGDVDPARLFGCGLYDPASKSLDVARWLRDEAVRAAQGGHGHAHDANRHDEHIAAFCVTHDEPIEWPAFAAWIQTLITHRGENLLRIKGIVNIAGERLPVAIHGIQHVFHPPVRLPAWPDADRRTRVVFITRDLARPVVENSLAALQKAAAETAG